MTKRAGSTRALRRLRLYVIERDQYRCQVCQVALTMHDPRQPTHGTLGHRRGREWAETRRDSLDPADYQAECAGCNYSHGASYGNARRAGGPPPGTNPPPGWDF